MRLISHIALSFLLLGGFLFAQGDEPKDLSKYIVWGSKQLEWSDFQGKVPGATRYAALTSSAIDMEVKGDGNIATFFVRTTFDPADSWSKKDKRSDFLLKHEQLHFDITEYHTRLLRQKLKSVKFKSVSSIGPTVQKLFRKISTKADKMQDKYDKETNHSIITDKQKEWNEKIEALLDETDEHTQTEISVDLSYLIKK